MNELAEFKSVSADLGQLAAMSAALESYAELLNGNEAVLADSRIGRAIQLGMESIDPTLDIKEGTDITLRAIKEGIKTAAKATWAAIKYLFEVISSMYVKFTGSLSKVRGHAKGTAKALGKLGNKVSYKKMTISGTNRLSVNGTFVGDNLSTLEDIKAITDYLLNDYPKTVTQVARFCNREFMNIVEDSSKTSNAEVAAEAITAFAMMLSRTMQLPKGGTKADPRELPSIFKDADEVSRSKVLPGNYALVYTDPRSLVHRIRGQQTGNYAHLISQAFTIRFTELALNTAERTDRQVDVPSVQVLTQLVSGISNILDIAEKGQDGRRDFDVVKITVDDTIRQIAERSKNVSNANNVLLHMLGAISQKLAEPMGNFTHWLAVTLNIYLTYIDHCIRHYREEGV